LVEKKELTITNNDNSLLSQIFMHEALTRNTKKLESIYAQSICNDGMGKIDHRYFIEPRDKLKTPIKLVSPFNARIGPMQRLKPPAAPAKK
jgi:hypothetical protein